MKKIIIAIVFIVAFATNVFFPTRSGFETDTISLELVQAKADENSEEDNLDPSDLIYPYSEPPSFGLFDCIRNLVKKYF